MALMFKSMDDTGLKGFLEASNSVYEGAVTEFFVNAKVIAGTIVSFVANRKMVINNDMFTAAFGTKRAKKVPSTANDQAESQPNPIPELPIGGAHESTDGEPEAHTESTPAFETRDDDDSIACGPEGCWRRWRIRIAFLGGAAEVKSFAPRYVQYIKLINKPFIGRLSIVTLLGSRRLAPTSFTGKPALQKPALEGLTNLARTETPRKADRNKSDHGKRRRTAERGGAWEAHGGRPREGGGGGAYMGARYLCDPQWFRDTASRGPTTIVTPKSQFRTCPTGHGKHLATSPHDPLGITDSACKNQSVMVSVQYGPFNIYIPIRSTTIGESRVAKDPIAMHTSWRSNSDIANNIGYPRMKASGESSTTKHRLLHASGPHPILPPNDPKGVGKRVKVRRLSCIVSMTFRVVRTNQYNQDLGLIHSTNGNHMESPNEGSSIDHQVTIHLHAQNITMFPTNETWYFTSQMLVSSSGGLILILTAQSTRNEFRMHSDY
ncbi:hypothetical protein F511_16489 [Dorcoceras hygrometricum]|uniref:Uncharacterized protein n=1 Tax=Dorcoceras hygrometricum TaxID=472368 RepID=A0A2Z7BAR7_9LAMI|nr:hypothetical protein F511_16489 [Dorcoceras hygrometricum]